MINTHLLHLGDKRLTIKITFRTYCTRVTYVYHIHAIINHEDHNCTASRLIYALTVLKCNCVEKIFLCLDGAVFYSKRYVGWKLRLHNDVVVEIVFQIFSTFVSSMAIKHSKDLNFGPI